MLKCYKEHYLNEEQKILIEDNLPLLWWFLYKQVVVLGIIQYSEIEECQSNLMWYMCMSAERFNDNKGVKFGTFAMLGLKSGLSRYLDLRNRRWSREILTDFKCRGDDGKEYSAEPKFISRYEKRIFWNDVKELFNMITMTSLEKKIIYYYYKKRYTFKKIGEIVGYSRERIRQIHKGIIDKIKIKVEEYDLVIKDFL